MAPRPMFTFIFAMALAIAAVVAINTLAAMPKAATTGPIFQPGFQKVF